MRHFFSPPSSPFLPPLVSFLPVSLCTVRPLITDAQTGQKKTIYKYIPQLRTESSSICNTGITSIFQNLPVSTGITSISQNLPVSAILIFGNDQYLLALQILENSGRYWDTSIYQYLYQYCRNWKILVKYWYYQYRGRLLHFD